MIEKGIPERGHPRGGNSPKNLDRKLQLQRQLRPAIERSVPVLQRICARHRQHNARSKWVYNSSRTKQGIVGGIMAFGALTTSIAQSILVMMSTKKYSNVCQGDRNIIIPAVSWGGDPKEYATIPLPYGYNVFHNLGENAYLVSSGNLSPEDAAVRSTNVFLGSFNPLGTSSSETYLGSVAKTATPQVAKPVLELVMNENYFGSPIYPPDSPFGGAQEPLSRRAFSNTPQI